MALAPGLLIRNIRVDQLLGSGGMSEVWRGFDEKLRRPVALKVVHSRRRLDPLARARFLREAQILGSLEHPGICKVYDLEEQDGVDVMVLELVEGRSLRDAMARGLSRDQQLAVAEGIAEVLAVAHRLGIVHRDLKPLNVVCTSSGTVKVLDFDLAHRVGEETLEAARGAVAPDSTHDPADGTPTGAVVGTVGYMSPEQARGDSLTVASDLYSLGILLHELFTGSPAYAEAPTLEARLFRVSQANTLPVEGLDPELTALVEALKAADPEERPSAEEVLRRLRQLRTRPGARRRRRLLATAVVLLAAVTTVWLGLALLPGLFQGRLDGVTRVYLAPVVNATGDPALDWVDPGLTVIMAATLAAGTGLEVVVGDPVGSPAAPSELVVHSRLQRGKRGLKLGADLRRDAHPVGCCAATRPSALAAGEALLAELSVRLRPGTPPPKLATALSADANTDLLYGLGLEARHRGRVEEARRCFELCLERDPALLWARLQLAHCAQEAGHPEEARAMAEAVAALARLEGRKDLVRSATELAERTTPPTR